MKLVESNIPSNYRLAVKYHYNLTRNHIIAAEAYVMNGKMRGKSVSHFFQSTPKHLVRHIVVGQAMKDAGLRKYKEAG